jgi:hypothetical protein
MYELPQQAFQDRNESPLLRINEFAVEEGREKGSFIKTFVDDDRSEDRLAYRE